MIRLRDKVQVLNATGTTEDSHGNPVPDWGNASELWEPADMQPASSDEDAVGGNVTVSRWTLKLLPQTTATDRSRVRWDGELYEVVAEVQLVKDHAKRPHHRVTTAEKVTG